MSGIDRIRMFMWVLLPLVLALAGSTPAAGSPPRHICPWEAVEESSGYFSNRVKRGIVPPLPGKAFAILTVKEVTGLMEDGMTDPGNPLPVAILVYQPANGPPHVTWWFHEYGAPVKAIRDPNMAGVVAKLQTVLDAPSRSLSPAERKSFEQYVKQVKTGMVSRDQIKWHRAGTVIDLSDVPDKHRAWVRADVEVLSKNAPTILVTDRKLVSALPLAGIQLEEAGTLKSETETSFSGSRFTVHTVRRGGVVKVVVEPRAGLPAPDPRTRRIYVEGAAPSKEQYKAYDRAKIDVLVRSSKSARPLRDVDKDIDPARKLSRPAVFNGLPSSPEAIRAQDVAPAESKTWFALHEAVTTFFMAKKLAPRSTKQELLTELQTGDADIVFVYAHSDGKTLYLGKDSLTLAELTALPARKATRRVVVLISCSTGKPGSATRLSPSSFAELLLSKGFAGEVIAPVGAVQGSDVAKLLSRVLEAPIGELVRWMRSTFDRAGWTRHVELFIARRREVG